MATPVEWLKALPRLRHFTRLNPECRKGYSVGTQSLDPEHYEVWFYCEGCGHERDRMVVPR